MSAAREREPIPPVDLRRKALVVLFWFIALSLLFNSLFGDMGLIQGFPYVGPAEDAKLK